MPLVPQQTIETVREDLEVARDRAMRSLTVVVEEPKGREIAMGDLQRHIRDKIRVMPDVSRRDACWGDVTMRCCPLTLQPLA